LSIHTRFRNLLLVPAAVSLMGGASPQSGNVTPVSVTIIAKCTITSPVPLAFGNYDPVVVNRTANLDVSPNALSVACTRGAPGVTIALDNGTHYGAVTAGKRYLADTATPIDYLNYEVYTTSARTTVWNSTNTVSYTSTSMAAHAVTVYGRVPFGQDVKVNANYSDSMVATVNF